MIGVYVEWPMPTPPGEVMRRAEREERARDVSKEGGTGRKCGLAPDTFRSIDVIFKIYDVPKLPKAR